MMMTEEDDIDEATREKMSKYVFAGGDTESWEFGFIAGLDSASEEIDRLKAELSQLKGMVDAAECVWEMEDSEFGGPWNSQCSVSWSFEYDGPEENGVKFCLGCGKPVKIRHPDLADYDPHFYDDDTEAAINGGTK